MEKKETMNEDVYLYISDISLMKKPWFVHCLLSFFRGISSVLLVSTWFSTTPGLLLVPSCAVTLRLLPRLGDKMSFAPSWGTGSWNPWYLHSGFYTPQGGWWFRMSKTINSMLIWFLDFSCVQTAKTSEVSKLGICMPASLPANMYEITCERKLPN